MSGSRDFFRGALTALAGATLSFGLTACGSGGGGGSASNGPTNTVAGAAEGRWLGDDVTYGFIFEGITLESGEFWFLNSLRSPSGNLAAGTIVSLVQGYGSISGDRFSASSGDLFWIDPSARERGALNSFGGKLVYRATFDNGNYQFKLASTGLTYTASFATGYIIDYDKAPPSLESLAGQWEAFYPQVPGGSAWIQSGAPNLGRFQVSELTQFGCALAGNLSPRSTGKNVFNVEARMSQAVGAKACDWAGDSFSGVAYYTRNSTGGPRLVVTALNPSRTFPLVLLVDK